MVSNTNGPRLYELSPDVGVLVRRTGPVIDRMEASFLEYVFRSFLCDALTAGDHALLVFIAKKLTLIGVPQLV